MSRYNRLSRPIAILGSRAAYMRLCDFANVDPNNNDVFFRVHDPETATRGEFSRVLELADAQDATRNYNAVKSLALDRVRNEARATKIDPRKPVEE